MHKSGARASEYVPMLQQKKRNNTFKGNITYVQYKVRGQNKNEIS